LISQYNMKTRIFTPLSLLALCWIGLLPVRPVYASNLLDVRVGPHRSFDRIVFEFDSEVPSRVIMKANQKVEVHFANIHIPDRFSVPMLPRGLTILKGIDVRREGADGVVFDIMLARDAMPTELPLAGRPWRLALDLAPRLSDQTEEKPEYIPGDQPIPTKFAETVPTAQDSTDPARLRSVLAYYYLARGDTPEAKQQAGLYQQLTGSALNLFHESGTGKTPPQQAVKPQPKTWNLPVQLQNFSPITLLAGAAGVGFILGLIVRGLLGRIKSISFHLPRIRLPKRKPKEADLSEELAQGMEALDEAVKEEPPRKAAKTAAPPAPEPEPEPVDAEKELRESVMDRRVRRVLELSGEGRTVASIAEELQMGQDEVKLILDLNKQ